MGRRQLTVGLKTQESGIRRVGKLLAYPDGGFGLVPLYHPTPHPGFALMQVPTDYSKQGKFTLPRASLLREYRSGHGVKLSLHGDGFVQFSRAGTSGILSGRDPTTGEIRGFGLHSFSPMDPPRTGPMFSMSAWGLSEYETVERGARGTLTVDERSFYYEQPNRTGQSAYVLEFWPLPRYALPYARHADGLVLLAGPRHDYYAGQPFEFIVLDLGHPLMILGLVVTVAFSMGRGPSGCTLSSPSDRALRSALIAESPPPAHAQELPLADFETGIPSLEPIRPLVIPLVFNPSVSLDRPWGRRPS